MKKIIYIVIGVAALLVAASCEKNPEWNTGVSDQAFTLTFTTGKMATRTVDGVDNEDLIKRIDYFFFPYGTDGEVDPEAEYVYKGTLIPEDDGLAGSYTESITPGVLNKIFPNGNEKAVVLAIANYIGKYGPTAENPETTIPEDAKTWEDLHSLVVGPTFFKDGGPGFQLRWPRKLNPGDDDLFFVMAGEVEVSLNTSGRYAINAEVPLKRLASKVTVQFTFEECIDDKGIKWVPQYLEDDPGSEEARVFLSNAIEHTTIGGPLASSDLVGDSWGTATQPLGNGNRDVFEYAYDFLLDIAEVGGKKTAHYYTYPISMEEGDDNQPYLKLILPWYGYKNLGSEQSANWVKYSQKEVYYKIVLPHETICDPNMIYEFDVTVNVIGNEKEVMVTGEMYKVKDWSSDEAVENNVGLGRYISLDIPKDTYDMYGDKVQILFVSSGEVEISQLKISKPNVNGDPNRPMNEIVVQKNANGQLVYGRYSIRSGNNGNYTYSTGNYNANTKDAKGVTVENWVDVDGTQLVINHALNRDLSSEEVDITQYIFEVTLHLKGVTGTQFDRTVTITQYPPIFAAYRTTQNTSTIFLNNTQYTGTARRVENNNGKSLGYIGNSTSGRTKAIISVTTLASVDATKYTDLGIAPPVIGDPRIALGSNYPVNPYTPLENEPQAWVEDDLGAAGNNYIAGYLYTDMQKTNVIAPKFMLASGYGGCNGDKVGWASNAERCAAYQEDGYPAGRWRLPTEAEMVFVYTLANDYGLLDNPFYSTSHYWANAGRNFFNEAFETSQGSYPNNDNNRHGWSSRCVYDLWYWGDDPVLTGNAATQWSDFMTSLNN